MNASAHNDDETGLAEQDTRERGNARREADPNRYGERLLASFEHCESGVPARLTRPGRQGAIERGCVHCIFDPGAPGAWIVQTELCTDYECPLWMHRPVRGDATRHPYADAVLECYKVDPVRAAATIEDPYAVPSDAAPNAEVEITARRERARERGHDAMLRKLEETLGTTRIDDAAFASHIEGLARTGTARIATRRLEAALHARETESGETIIGPKSNEALNRLR